MVGGWLAGFCLALLWAAASRETIAFSPGAHIRSDPPLPRGLGRTAAVERAILLPHCGFGPRLRAEKAASSSLSTLSEEKSECGTILKLTDPSTGRLVTLIGTAHLSQKSNEQVNDFISSSRPSVVVIELDEGRLERIGLSPSEMPLPYVTVDDIVPPPTEADIAFESDRPWWNPAREALLDLLTRIGRSALTGMYDGMSEGLGDDVVGGGEFLAAIKAAELAQPDCRKIVLGDRDSLKTLRRAADLALRSGDPLGVLARLSEANRLEMDNLEARVRAGMPDGANEAEVTRALIEEVKADDGFRSRVFGRLEMEVPEFTQAFLADRDYIMAEAVRREEDAQHVVAVMGLAHLPGVAENLRASLGEKNTQGGGPSGVSGKKDANPPQPG